MKKYIKPMSYLEKIEVCGTLLSGSGPEGSQVDGVMAKKNNFQFLDDDEEWGTTLPKQNSPWKD